MVTYNKHGRFVKHIENVVRKYEMIMSLRRRNRLDNIQMYRNGSWLI